MAVRWRRGQRRSNHDHVPALAPGFPVAVRFDQIGQGIDSVEHRGQGSSLHHSQKAFEVGAQDRRQLEARCRKQCAARELSE